MTAARPLHALLAALLALHPLLASRPVAAQPTDGSTHAADRGATPAPAADGRAVRADLFQGAATYAIPLALPRGTGGLTPQLALRYASHARRDSWVGFGWSLGAPAIARSLAEGAPGYDDADGFELAGRRLLPSPDEPGRYHTRVESFQRIRREGDGSWTVTDPDGTLRRFGADENARVRPPDRPDVVFSWLLSWERDVHGNVLRYHYDRRDPGVPYLSELRYTLRAEPGGAPALVPGLSERVVRFELEPRDDVAFDHRAGFRRVLAHRLRRIDVRVGARRLRLYELEYASSPDSFRSLLASVSLLGVDGDPDDPGSPRLTTRFDYRSNVAAGTTGWGPPGEFEWGVPHSLVDAEQRDAGVRLADVDGDARPDLVKAFGTGDVGSAVTLSPDSGVYRNTGSGFESERHPGFWGEAGERWPRAPHVGGGGSVPLVFAAEVGGARFGTGNTLVDLTGDGRADVMGALGVLPPPGPLRGLGQAFQGPWCASTGASFECLSSFPGQGTALPAAPHDALFTALLAYQWGDNDHALDEDVGIAYLGGNVRLADLDGDGLPELVVRGEEIHTSTHQRSVCDLRVTTSFVLRNGGGIDLEADALAFEEPEWRDVAAPRLGCADARASLSRRWQLCDLATGDAACRARSLFNVTEASLSAVYGAWVVLAHPELGNLLVDLDGDGLADALAATRDEASGLHTRHAALNDGAGGFRPADDWALPVDVSHVDSRRLWSFGNYFYGYTAGESRDTGVRLADVNGDGRVDLLEAREGEPARVWLNDGDGAAGEGDAGPWVESPHWSLPEGLAFADADGRDTGLRLVDVDGDGLSDLVHSQGGDDRVHLHRGSLPDLLVGVTAPLGARTSLSYAPSSDWEHTGDDGVPDLPVALPLVSAIELDDGVHPPTRRVYDYAGGRLAPGSREQRGFRQVSERVEALPPPGEPGAAEVLRVTVTRFHQDEARAGLEERVSLRDGQGRPWLERETRYGDDPDGRAPWISLPVRILETRYDGGSEPLRVGSALRYDEGAPGPPRGQLTRRIDYGEVDADFVDLDPSDTRSTRLLYAAPNEEAWILDRVCEEQLVAGTGDGPPLARTLLHYDGAETPCARPERGVLTRRTQVLDLAAGTGPTTSFEHDPTGNVVSEISPRAHAGEGGGVTHYELDPTRTFRTARVDAAGHRSETRYEPHPDCDVAMPAGAGLPSARRGPNELVSGAEALRCYDTFGRPTLERGPAGHSERRIAYDDTPGSARVVETRRVTRAGDLRVTRRSLDGRGRPIATRVDGPQGRAVLTARGYDALDRLAWSAAPHFEGDPAPITQRRYDPLGRLVEREQPGGRVSRWSRALGVETQVDPLGVERARVRDAFGRLVAVREPGDGTVPSLRYVYDRADRLLRVEDAAGHVTRIEYDALGRRTALHDPDAGTTRFEAYDAHGNLLRSTDAAGVTTWWTWDALDRPVLRLGSEPASWIYDTAPGGIGRLAQRLDGGSLYAVEAYDAQGRPVRERFDVPALGVIETGYDPLGRIETRRYPDGTRLRWRRDAAGYTVAVVEEGVFQPLVAGIEWSAGGGLAAWTGRHGLTTRRRYDVTDASPTGRLREVRVETAEGQLVAQRGLAYDARDRVVEVEDLADGRGAARFDYDPRGRLVAATGAYGEQGAARSLAYAYDEIGRLRCKDAPAGTEPCSGTSFAFPEAGPGAVRPHAPLRVDGVVATWGPTGRLERLGERALRYDALGRLVGVEESGRELARFAYDASGRRVSATSLGGRRPLVRHFASDDFEWDATRGLARIHVPLGGAAGGFAVTLVRPFGAPAAGGAAPAGVGAGAARPRVPTVAARPPWPGPAAAGAAALALALALPLAARRRRGQPLGRATLASATVWAFLLGPTSPAWGLADGDLSGDGALDAADLLRAHRLAVGDLPPSGGDLARGDVAPLAGPPDDAVDVADAMLIARALRGDDVDGDGLASEVELAAGASPFRADSDGDGLGDGREVALGSDPARPDSDGDGLGDAQEVGGGSDPLTADTDGDGLGDASDPEPRAGALYRHADALGSPLLLARSDGGVLARPVFRPFGGLAPAGAADPPLAIGFTGQRHEAELGLYDYGARWYDPLLGRFLQPDALVPDPTDPRSLDRYAYVRNDPVNRVDPSGRFDFGAIFGGIASAFSSFFGGLLGSGLRVGGLSLGFGPGGVFGIGTGFFGLGLTDPFEIGRAPAPPRSALPVRPWDQKVDPGRPFKKKTGDSQLTPVPLPAGVRRELRRQITRIISPARPNRAGALAELLSLTVDRAFRAAVESEDRRLNREIADLYSSLALGGGPTDRDVWAFKAFLIRQDYEGHRALSRGFVQFAETAAGAEAPSVHGFPMLIPADVGIEWLPGVRVWCAVCELRWRRGDER